MVPKPSFQGIKETMPGNYHIALKSMGHVANWWLLVFSISWKEYTLIRCAIWKTAFLTPEHSCC